MSGDLCPDKCFAVLCRFWLQCSRGLRDAVRRKLAEKWRTNRWFLLRYSVPAHWSVLVKDLSGKNYVTTLEHPPYSSNLTATDFHLFSWLKSALKGQCFCDGTDIIKNVMDELKKLPGMFPAPLQLLAEVYSCTRELFWRKRSLNDCTVLNFSLLMWFW